ncbi:MAG: 4Fe-4S dicluster domain-containing protein [Candidatus Loosdrechtia sp.]|uniref:4Fe-4S dicluster domain-containing protein n=1 Tax=Candidatus Loosdrechtia sp. TaxID=3101272 RepID=UPI003A7436DA|nr:MAG: 4Fe-4S dicluster domain-containing protein [Candidatus Jettenia sp. AMX2]
MTEPSLQPNDQIILEHDHFQKLFDVLTGEGYQIIGPALGEGSIVYRKLDSVSELPAGWTDEQEGGMYRLRQREDKSLFGYTVGPHSWKNSLFPSVQRLLQVTRKDNGFHIKEKGTEEGTTAPKFAFLGVRSCDIHAISIQDKVFIQGKFVDPDYKARRENTFIAAVHCGKAGGTCFCASMGTGPRADSGFDIAMTEIIGKDCHYFLVETGTEKGAGILREVPHRKANEEEKSTASDIVKKTAGQMGRYMNTDTIKDILYRNYEHPRWDDVAKRCLACANCTLVCPTCFCATVEDTVNITGESASRWRKLDSCFNLDHSYIHGGSIRSSARSRYRQWLTHKIATWIDQFGTMGCVGCGRCITWCPVAIDITEEIRAIRESEQANRQSL